jgi:hypothetical protein
MGKRIDTHQEFKDGVKIINSSLNTTDIRFIFPDIDVEAGQVYELDPSAVSPYTIVAAHLKTDLDSLTATISINGVPLTGLTDINVTDQITEYALFDSTNDKLVSIGDVVTLTITGITDNPSKLIGKVKILLT